MISLVERFWNGANGITESRGEKPVSLALSLPEMSHGRAWDRGRASVLLGTAR